MTEFSNTAHHATFMTGGALSTLERVRGSDFVIDAFTEGLVFAGEVVRQKTAPTDTTLIWRDNALKSAIVVEADPPDVMKVHDGTAWVAASFQSIFGSKAWKAPVRAATTADITLSGAQTIDGVSLVAGDRVLVKDQATGSENGIYVVAAGAWSRSRDAAATGLLLPGTQVLVTEGTTSAENAFAITTDGVITLGTTAINWASLTGSSSPLSQMTIPDF